MVEVVVVVVVFVVVVVIEVVAVVLIVVALTLGMVVVGIINGSRILMGQLMKLRARNNGRCE